jgi:uridine kinase
LPEPVDNPKLSRIFREAEKWGAQLGVENVADLNDVIKTWRYRRSDKGVRSSA